MSESRRPRPGPGGAAARQIGDGQSADNLFGRDQALSEGINAVAADHRNRVRFDVRPEAGVRPPADFPARYARAAGDDQIREAHETSRARQALSRLTTNKANSASAVIVVVALTVGAMMLAVTAWMLVRLFAGDIGDRVVFIIWTSIASAAMFGSGAAYTVFRYLRGRE